MRLDKYLTLKFPNHSRAFLKSQIKSGNILVNGETKKPSYALKENDRVEINIKEKMATQLKQNLSIKLNIIYEDKNVIAIDKPAGISVHPAKTDQADTIANALLAYYPAIKEVGDPSTDSTGSPQASSGQANLRPGIVHRLDKDTSGILIIAKNNLAFDWLKKQFVQRKVVKKYLALVMGNIKKEKGVIAKPIGKTKDFRKRTTIPLKKQKGAITYYRIIKYFPSCHPERSEGSRRRDSSVAEPVLSASEVLPQNDKFAYTLVEAEPKTGRTHQIRVHLASIGHPLAGDKLYGFKNQICPLGLKRHFLHASYLKISLPDGKIVELYSKLPEDLNEILYQLKSQ